MASNRKRTTTIDYAALTREAMQWPTIPEVAELYGVPQSWVRKWMEDRRISGLRLGGHYRVDPKSVDRYLATKVTRGRY